jgi:hypothetical protein
MRTNGKRALTAVAFIRSITRGSQQVTGYSIRGPPGGKARQWLCRQGHISDNFPPGYSTPYVIETNASWVENPGGAPRYYLKLDQSVVNVSPGASGPLDWFLTAAAPWDFEHAAAFPETCIDKTHCTSAQTGALATGRYADAARTTGFATVVPTAGWRTGSAYIRDNAEYVVLLYGAVWNLPPRSPS